jgi:hypothetical protein
VLLNETGEFGKRFDNPGMITQLVTVRRKAPNPKHQVPEKFQKPSSNFKALGDENWN